MKVKIIIPMSGQGSRFVRAGYQQPKPLIEVDGMPMIEHVVNLFPKETGFIFICREDHLQATNMESILRRIAPEGKIISISPHKQGPVYAVTRAMQEINDEEEVIINYCDFSCYWSYDDFLARTRERNADGAIPAYRGFHPHMLGTTNYAFMRHQHNWMLEIKEKQPFTSNRMEEFASSGTYYFKKGFFVKKYFTELMEKNIHVNGEYYVSLVYNLLQRDGLHTFIYEIQHMLQWGTPEDMEAYQRWSSYFHRVMEGNKAEEIYPMTTILPLAGAGSRFARNGYSLPKPFIEVSGKPMFIQANAYLPQANKQFLMCLEEHMQRYDIEQDLRMYGESGEILVVEELMEGQAKTCALALDRINLDESLLISACDHGALWNEAVYQQLMQDDDIDAIIWTFRRHPSSKVNPEMYGWVKVDTQNRVTEVSVKQPISDHPYDDHAIVGTFYFRKASYFQQAINRLFAKNIRVNGEFYIDSCFNELIEMGLHVKVLEVDHYIGWGTPTDLKTFQYWQSFFHKCAWHPYRLHLDTFINKDKISELDALYQWKKPVSL